MKITETYLKNVKEIEKFIKTMSFDADSEQRIKQFINDPLSILNDDIKELFRKYDNEIVDYRIPVPTSIISQNRFPKEVSVVMNTITDCLINDDVIKFDLENKTSETNLNISNVSISLSSVAGNTFAVKNDRRKVWKYLNSRVMEFSKLILKNITNNCSAMGTFDLHDSCYLAMYFKCMNDYVVSLGTRVTSLKKKIDSIDYRIDLSLDSTKIIKKISEVVSTTFNVMQEIISARLLDASKFSLYLSFNVFDWLLASTGETFHSCIDMQSSYCYGLGMLGMCACPDWGMLLYTDNTEKEFMGIDAFHIITRSWICYTKNKSFQFINWYPKDIRGTVEINADLAEEAGLRIMFDRSDLSAVSFSSWKPIRFANGGCAWIYSDLPKFIINDDRKTVHFKMCGTGIPDTGTSHEDDTLITGTCQNDRMISAVQRWNNIAEAVKENIIIGNHVDDEEDDENSVTCCECGETFDRYSDDITWVDEVDDYVCQDCLDNNFFYCDVCESYHRNEDAVEVYYGDDEWSYEYVCQECAKSSEAFWDEKLEKYFFTDKVECFVVTNKDDSTFDVSEFTINNALGLDIFEHTDGSYYSYEEEEEEE